MFRAEIRWLANGPTLKMEGSLIREWAEQARSLVTKEVVPEGLIIDLTEVRYIDPAGEEFLKWLGSLGVEFVAESLYAGDVCERLHLPVMENITARPKQRH
jgi:anti-anti-sigma regulatory factor